MLSPYSHQLNIQCICMSVFKDLVSSIFFPWFIHMYAYKDSETPTHGNAQKMQFTVSYTFLSLPYMPAHTCTVQTLHLSEWVPSIFTVLLLIVLKQHHSCWLVPGNWLHIETVTARVHFILSPEGLRECNTRGINLHSLALACFCKGMFFKSYFCFINKYSNFVC